MAVISNALRHCILHRASVLVRLVSWFYFICCSISCKKNLVIKLNGDDTKTNIALSFYILMTVFIISHK